ncbi:MAG: O-antigen ligase family protein [Acidimicrobiia bacterium]
MRVWIIGRFGLYARVVLVTGLFLSPVVFSRRTADVFNLFKITVLWVAAIIAIALWLIWSAERGIWLPRLRLLYPVVAFLLVATLATLFSENPGLSVVGLYHRYGGLLPFALYALVFLTIAGLYWERPERLKEIAWAGAGAATIMAGYVLIQAAGLDWITWRAGDGKAPEFPVGTMGNSNFAGGYLGLAAPFLLYLALSIRSDFWRTIAVCGVGLELLALWYTQSRGGMIAAGTAFMFMAFAYRDRFPRWFNAAVAGLVAFAAVIALLVVWHPGSDKAPGPLANIQTLRTGTLQIRVWYWQAAWRIFLDHPILGTGLETYFANYPKYRTPEDGKTLGMAITDKPHNIYLEYAANSGILGVGTYLAVLGFGIFYGYRQARRLEGAERLVLTTFMGALGGYVGQGFFSIDVPPLAMMGWVALGGVAATGDPAVVAARQRILDALRTKDAPSRGGKQRKKSRNRMPASGVVAARRGPVRWPVHAGAVLMALLLVVLGVRPVLADVRVKSALAAERSSAASTEIVPYLEKAVRLDPRESAYRAHLARIAERRAHESKVKTEKNELFSQAADRYLDAYRLQPGNLYYISNVARIYGSWGAVERDKFLEAEKWWKLAITRDPTDWEVHNNYANMLATWANASGDKQLLPRTLDELELVIELKPTHVLAWINLAKIHRAMGNTEEARAAANRVLEIEPGNEKAQEVLKSLQP